jgi:hypothetical protein
MKLWLMKDTQELLGEFNTMLFVGIKPKINRSGFASQNPRSSAGRWPVPKELGAHLKPGECMRVILSQRGTLANMYDKRPGKGAPRQALEEYIDMLQDLLGAKAMGWTGATK